MSKVTQSQIAFALDLFKQHAHEQQVFVKVENGHMYFKKEAALISVGNDPKKLEVIDRDGNVSEVKDDKPSKPASSEPKMLTEMKYTELKAYAESKGIALDASDNSREKALAKIQAAETPATGGETK